MTPNMANTHEGSCLRGHPLFLIWREDTPQRGECCAMLIAHFRPYSYDVLRDFAAGQCGPEGRDVWEDRHWVSIRKVAPSSPFKLNQVVMHSYC